MGAMSVTPGNAQGSANGARLLASAREDLQRHAPTAPNASLPPSVVVVSSNWVQATPATSPGARSGAMMAYYGAVGNVVLFGGYNNGYLSDTWTWNGTTWTEMSPATSPSPRQAATITYDAANRNVLLAGGVGPGPTYLNDQWTWNGSNWTLQSPSSSPSARGYSTLSYDTNWFYDVLFGGYNGHTAFSDTWTWNGASWTQMNPGTAPTGRYNAVTANDPLRKNVLLFGGVDINSNILGDTWTWNGTTWAKPTLTTNPPARFDPTLTFDTATGTMVLFGGDAGFSGPVLNDTWTWNGTAWTQQSPLNSPSVRDKASMVYDAATQTIMLFGGYNTGAYDNDTWNYSAVPLPVFSNTAVGNSTAATATFGFTAGGSIGAPVVLTQGAPNLDFTDAGTGTCTTNGTSHVYAVNDTCTVNVNFAPKYPGQRMGAIEITDTSGNVLVTEFISGTGTGPLATFTPGTLNTVAGSGTPCDTYTAACGDGGLATAATAQFKYVYNVGVDDGGNTYIADYGDNRVRKVTAATGVLSTVAGTGTPCNSPTSACGDGGLATASGADLYHVTGVAVDGAGNLYIDDYADYRIRKVTASTGLLSTVAGTGAPCPSSTSTCGDGGLATASGADFYYPTGIAVDGAGNLYIADTFDHRIREVTASNGLLSTVAGSGTPCSSDTAACGDGGAATASGADLNYPYGLAVDGAGNIYIADYGDNRIRKVTAATGILSTVAGTGTSCDNTACGDGGSATATGAELSNPSGVSVDGAGNIYIADYGDNRIRKVTAATGIITTVAGSGTYCSASTHSCGDGSAATASTADFNGPYGVAVDGAGNFYIGDGDDNRVRIVTATAATVNFADTTAGSTSATQTLTVNNAGYDPAASNPLTFPIPAVGSTNPSVGSNFNISNTSTCPQLTSSSGSAGTLAAGASCTYVLNYQPLTPGAVAHFLTLTNNSLNVTNAMQNTALAGSTGGLGVGVQNATVALGSTVTLSFTVGYGGNGLPTATPTLTIDSSTTGVGAISCTVKAGHSICAATFDPTGYAVGPHTITATQPADSNYATTSGTGTLIITTAGGSDIRKPSPLRNKPVSPSVAPAFR